VRINGPMAYVALYAALYGAFGASSPFWPKFFETKALSSQQIGLLLGATLLMRLVTGPLVGRLADLSRALRLVLSGCAILAAGMAAVLVAADSFWFLLLIALIQAGALAPTTSISDALSINAAKPKGAGRSFEYGWIRGSASAAFVAGTLIVGQLISQTELGPIIWMNVVLLLTAAALTALLSEPATPEPHTNASLSAPKLRELLGIPGFRALIVVSALVYGSHAMHDAFAVVLWSDAGMSPSVISLLWSEAVASEVVVFFLIGPALVNRVGPRGAAVLAAVAGIVRWFVASVTTSVLMLSIIQPLHGLTFALLHLACMSMMGSMVPVSLSATAQAFYALGGGFVTAGLTFSSGFVYARYGGAAFYPMAFLCGLALPFAWFGLTDTRE